MATTKISLKLFIDKKGRRVLFAEADKEFVDFLYSIFTLPVGAVTSLLQEGGGMVGSLPSLYQSIENLSETRIFQPDTNKRFLLEPMLFMPGAKVPFLLPNVGSTAFRQFYRCGLTYTECGNYVADDNSTICPECDSEMNNLVTILEPTSANGESSTSEEDYVKRTATYVVMDDMEVKPLSSTILVPLLTKFNDTNDIEEKVVDVGMDEGVKLLQASLQSKTVLTDVFLPAEITKTDEESIIKRLDYDDLIIYRGWGRGRGRGFSRGRGRLGSVTSVIRLNQLD